jgi:hypothetical protein
MASQFGRENVTQRVRRLASHTTLAIYCPRYVRTPRPSICYVFASLRVGSGMCVLWRSIRCCEREIGVRRLPFILLIEPFLLPPCLDAC